MWRAYYRLTKPGIIYGNVFTTVAGFLFASELRIDPVLLIAVVAGMALVIAGACVFNNVIDRDIDARMERTKDRATVTGLITVPTALAYGGVLSLAGFTALLFHTNLPTTLVALTGFVTYVFLYSFSKRITRLHTLIGSISGAVPILAGYVAVTAHIDSAGIILFLILVLWQMPHFYSIAFYRLHEYAAAGIPLLPSVKGAHLTKIVILAYIIVFVLAESSLTLLGYTGFVYLGVVLAFGVSWLVRALKGFSAADDTEWGKSLFFFSINVLMAFSIALALSPILP